MMRGTYGVGRVAMCGLGLVGVACGVAHGVVVNIDATRYGFAAPTDPAPVVGRPITPITNPPGQPLLQLTLPAGRYRVSNASGLPGANSGFTGWRYNAGANWVWNFVISDNTTGLVVYYADRGMIQPTQEAIASQPDVIAFRDTFTLSAATTLNFMIRDYFLDDNAGGMALQIEVAPPLCIADVDDGTGSGTPDGGVTIDDLLYYLDLFGSGVARADVDDGSGTGTPDGGVTIDDLLYYLVRFEAGC